MVEHNRTGPRDNETTVAVSTSDLTQVETEVEQLKDQAISLRNFIETIRNEHLNDKTKVTAGDCSKREEAKNRILDLKFNIEDIREILGEIHGDSSMIAKILKKN